MAGVFAYSAATFELAENQVTWSTVTEFEEREATLAATGAQTYTFPVTSGRITAIEATVTWTDTEGNNDRFKVELRGPEADWSNSAEDATGTATARFALTDVPPDGPGRGFDDNATIDDADPGTPAWTGTKDWTVTVTLMDAPPAACPVPCLQQPPSDGANAFTLNFKVIRYVGTVSR